MREAIGGTSLLMLVAIFLTVYIGFMAIVINYGRVFRVKNTLLTHIESHDGIIGSESEEELINKARSMGYNNGIKVCYSEGKTNTYYYSIEVSAQYSMPLTSQKLNIKIKGDTSAITAPKSTGTSNGSSKSSISECKQGFTCLGDTSGGCAW